MKHVLPAVVASLLLTTAVSAEEATPQAVNVIRRLISTPSPLCRHHEIGPRSRDTVKWRQRLASRNIPTSTARSVGSSSQSIRSSAKPRLAG